MNPKFTPCLFLNFSLYFFLKSNILDISTSLKVVNIAVSFFTLTSLSATFLLSIESFCLLSGRSFWLAEPIAGFPSRISCFVILPPFPVGVILLISIFLSIAIFLAAGLTTGSLEVSFCTVSETFLTLD